MRGKKAGHGLGTALLLWLALTPLTALATNDPGFTQRWSLTGAPTPGAAFLNGDGTQSGKGAAAVQDGKGHGSMTTGLIAASTGNSAGIAAVAPGNHALIIKVLDNSGSGSANDVAASIRYAADAVAAVSPSPTASPSPSPSPSPLFGVIPSNGPDVAPGTTLASDPASGPPAPLVLVAATLIVGAAVGYGGSWGAMLARRLRAAPDPGAPSG